MSIEAIRLAIVARMASVDDVGVVQLHERYAADLARLKTFYWSAPHNQLRGWYVRRIATAETGNRQAHTVEQLRWRVRGFMAFDDANASELTFDALIESLRDAFAQDETLGGTVDQCSDPSNPDGPTGLQLEDAGPVMFAGVLCHSCQASLTTVRYLERQP